jgi:DNA-binding transcriptional MerR regulator
MRPESFSWLTVGDVARFYGLEAWQVRKLWERRLLPPAKRIGMYRVFTEADLPQIENALRKIGYLPTPAAEDSHV